MKTNMKQLKLLSAILLSAFMFFTTSTKAQTTQSNSLRLGIGLDGGLVTGQAHDYSNASLGATARLQYGLTNNVALMVTSGYYNFFGKDVPVTSDFKYKSLGMIPIKAGVKLFTNSGVYVSGELGDGIETKTFNVPGTGFSDTHNKFIWSPGVGIASRNWDVGVRYEHYSGQDTGYGQVGLRVAYGFGI